MCKNTKRIRNKTRRPRRYVSKEYLDVGCGYCKDCKSRQINDWIVRSSAEYNRVKAKGGFVWFPTLTYDNSNIYYWCEDGKSIPCFCKEHFVSFRNKLRVYLKRNGFDFTGEDTIRYFYVTEYGKNTGRPHIHCLLFVPKFIDYNLFRSLVKKAWIYGYVGYSKIGATIDSMKAVQYTMKYLNKPVAWFHKYSIDEYLYKLKSDYLEEKDLHRRTFLESKYKAFRRHLPHHCQSMGYGSSLEVSDNEFINNSISASDIGLYDCLFSYKVPKYYIRKYLYDYDKYEKLFTINERGKYIARCRFPKIVDSMSRMLDEKCLSSYYDDMSRIVGDINIVPYYQDYIRLKDFDFDTISRYVLAFRNVQIPKILYDDLSNDSFVNVEKYIKENAFFYYCAQKDVSMIKPLSGERTFSKDEVLLFNDLPQFRTIENGLNFMDIADHLIAEKNIDAYYETLYKNNVQFKDYNYE